MDYDTTIITAADELIDAELGWKLVAQHDEEDYEQGYLNGLENEYNPDMAYSPAYVAGWNDSIAQDAYTEQPGYYESTRPDWF